ncbi:acyl-CoA dehydrogenase [Nocardiopsis sp. TSRI0078]|uniref:acyl-CoA dehydrogenase family protein n=1 Tax=unclassified Nocardiopsis TaxID=2649073 RepID=UPI00093CB20F|nr:acyl-CoA dehydrogenase family protein [Nocardiopsis sp. TSRI0078]OKI23473.1 acyl-CoA dehydrogenase [Nocardiopsis sp. TSRI0078]
MEKVPDREELVKRARAVQPVVEKHVRWQEENRRLHDEVVEALDDVGVFRMRVPARYGGYESDALAMAEVASTLAQADGATAWTTSVWWIPTWMVGMFPDHVQEEVLSSHGGRVCGTLSPSATAEPVDGGITVNGRWGFISGAPHSHWQEIIAMAPTPDGSEQYPVVALVPMSDLRLVDDWHSVGLRGSGSVTTVAEDVFVPSERVVPLPSVLRGESVSEANRELPMYRAPLLAVAAAASVGTPTGLAEAALDVFLERAGERGITYTDYARQADAPVTHLQVAEASLKVDQARFHGERTARLLDSKGALGEEWSLRERARCRVDVAAVCRLAKEAVTVLGEASGGRSVYTDTPMQRILRDVTALNLHALMYPQTGFELYGRVLAGLEPNTLYV